MAKLVLIRHGQSKWNLENKFTGWVDVPLTEKGELEARHSGHLLKGIHFDNAFTSDLKRAQKTLDIILKVIEQETLLIQRDKALNERHYGDLQGLDKAETAKKFGDAQVKIWRRSYDINPPNGESLKDTAARTLPYFEANILPLVQKGKNVLIAAHGNSLRSIVMHLDKLTKEQVLELNMGTGIPYVYDINRDGVIEKKEILNPQETK